MIHLGNDDTLVFEVEDRLYLAVSVKGDRWSHMKREEGKTLY